MTTDVAPANNGSTGPTLRAVVIGCGAIAGGYDEVARDGAVLTHAGGYHGHEGYRIAGCVDPDEPRRRAFMAKWNIPAGFRDLEECLNSGLNFEVASVCAPTSAHGPLLRRLLAHGVKAVFCEKPVTESLAETAQLVAGYQAAGIVLAVNYLRRWDPAMGDLRDELEGGKWGRVQEAVGFYNKGVLHTGSHMIDLMHLLLGPLTLDRVLHRRFDYSATDPTVDAVLSTTQGAPVYLVGGDSRRYARFEMSIACDNGVLEIEDFGFRVRRRPVEPHRYFPLVPHPGDGRTTATGLHRAMANAVDNLYAAVTRGAPLRSDGRTAEAAHRLCAEMIQGEGGN